MTLDSDQLPQFTRWLYVDYNFSHTSNFNYTDRYGVVDGYGYMTVSQTLNAALSFISRDANNATIRVKFIKYNQYSTASSQSMQNSASSTLTVTLAAPSGSYTIYNTTLNSGGINYNATTTLNGYTAYCCNFGLNHVHTTLITLPKSVFLSNNFTLSFSETSYSYSNLAVISNTRTASSYIPAINKTVRISNGNLQVVKGAVINNGGTLTPVFYPYVNDSGTIK